MNRAIETPCDVSIIVVSYNTRSLTLELLRSIHEQARDVNFEIVVIDNASSDGSADAISAEFPHVTLIVNQGNCGFAAANNQGMRRARGRYLLLLNPDTVVHDRAIDRCIAFADGQPDIGVVGCLIKDVRGQRQSSCMRVPALRWILLDLLLPAAITRRSRLFGQHRYVGADWAKTFDVEAVAGCFMLVRREVLKQVGAFDPNYFMYQEEVDWCYRIGRAGWRIVFYPGAWITHYGGAAADLVSERMFIEQAKSKLYFVRKHRGLVIAAFVNGLMFFHNLVRLPFFWFVQLLPTTQLGRHLTFGVLQRRLALHARAMRNLDGVLAYHG